MNYDDLDEKARFEDLLRKRGISIEGNPTIEKEILERYQDECAVLIMDSCGFTRITRKHGIIHFMAMIVAIRDAAVHIFDKYQAYSVWAEADNVYATFPTAKMAIDAAIKLQDAVSAMNAAREPDERLEIGMGIGCGRLLRIGKGDAYGDQMNQASKLGEDIAEADEILVTSEAWAAAKDKVAGVEAEPRTMTIGGADIRYFKISRG